MDKETIILIHDFNLIKDVIFTSGTSSHFDKASIVNKSLIKSLFSIAEGNTFNNIGWCHESLVSISNFELWPNLLEHPYQFLFYNFGQPSFHLNIGYVDFSSPFLHNIPQQLRYGTWVSSGWLGITSSTVIKQFVPFKTITSDFHLLVNLITKEGSKQGLFPYSEPALISNNQFQLASTKNSIQRSLSLIQLTYGKKWLLFYTLCLFIFEGTFLVFSFIKQLFHAKLPKINIEFESTLLGANTINVAEDTYSVIIPTLGRPTFLNDVLIDLSNQTLPPKEVIIIEQKALLNEPTDLTTILQTKFPFSIKHHLIYQLGACNARNFALSLVGEFKWVFFADDDIRFDKETIEHTIQIANQYQLNALTMGIYQKGQKPRIKKSPQIWSTFGSGCSVVLTKFATSQKFDSRLEFGYGEDGDYGSSLRKKGCDIGIINQHPILHLKAPIGGFRSKFIHPWEKEIPLPKPSPTILFTYLKNHSRFQLNGYKFFYILNRIISNKTLRIDKMIVQWNKSIQWANQMLLLPKK